MAGLNATGENLAMRIMAVAISLALLAFPFGNGYAPNDAAQSHSRMEAQASHGHSHAAGPASMAASGTGMLHDCDHAASQAVGAPCDDGNCASGLCHAMAAVPAISLDRRPVQGSPAGSPVAAFVMLAGEMADRPPRA